jgi:hypothetical protein
MFVFATLLSAILGAQTVAQTSPTPAPPAPAASVPVGPDTLNNGACMDSPRAVPLVLQPPSVRSMQIVRIDKIVSTASMLKDETVAFLYTLEDGSTWLGQRSADYMSAADARAANQILASTHMPDQSVTAFPPQMKYGVATKYQQFFKISLPQTALSGLQVRLDPCVAWPAGRELPDPHM